MKPRILAIEPGVQGRSGAALRVNGLLSRLAEAFEVCRLDVKELHRGLTALPAPPERRRFLASRPAWAPRFKPADRRRIDEALRRHLTETEADLLWIGHGRTAAKLGLPGLAATLRLPVVIDAYDLLWTALERRLASVRSSRPVLQALRNGRNRIEVSRARSFETRLYSSASQVWVCSELDRSRLRALGVASSVKVVANFFDIPTDRVGESTGGTADGPAIFVGDLGYYPNREGLEWFLSNAWPRILERRPEARLQVVGKWPKWARPGQVFEQPGVEVLGFVDDLDGLWSRASQLICPLLVGSGTRIKILEAWARGVPVVSTSIGAEGLVDVSGRGAVLADQAEDLADAVLATWADGKEWQRLAESGRGLWLKHYTLDRVSEAAIDACRRALADAAR